MKINVEAVSGRFNAARRRVYIFMDNRQVYPAGFVMIFREPARSCHGRRMYGSAFPVLQRVMMDGGFHDILVMAHPRQAEDGIKAYTIDRIPPGQGQEKQQGNE